MSKHGWKSFCREIKELWTSSLFSLQKLTSRMATSADFFSILPSNENEMIFLGGHRHQSLFYTFLSLNFCPFPSWVFFCHIPTQSNSTKIVVTMLLVCCNINISTIYANHIYIHLGRPTQTLNFVVPHRFIESVGGAPISGIWVWVCEWEFLIQMKHELDTCNLNLTHGTWNLKI